MSDAAQNTDRELWRAGDAFSDSIHVTEFGAIGINVGGHVIVMPLAEWFKAAVRAEQYRFALMEARGVISKALLTAQVTE